MSMLMTSAGGVLSLLQERDTDVKAFALQRLNQMVDMFWPEISEMVDKIEVLYEDQVFSKRDLAALVASKVYYHLGAYEESLTFALGAGDFFNVNETSEYVETIIAKCIDHYTKLQTHNVNNPESPVEIDPRLKDVVDRMFERCLDDRMFKQAVGIAIETHRLDIMDRAIMLADNPSEMLSYTLKVCMMLVQSRAMRNLLLRQLVRLYMGLPQPDFISICQCLIFLDDPDAVADILISGMRRSEESALMGYQIGFDLYDSATQQFLSRVQTAVRRAAPQPISDQPPPLEKAHVQVSMDTEDAPETEASDSPKKELTSDEKLLQKRLEHLVDILTGELTIQLHLQFLIRNNHADQLILKNTKDSVRNSVCHTATVISSALMHCGTTSDSFLRDNLDWLSKATNWAKFTATASLGVIHRGHESDALNLMSAYLPKDSSPGSAYSDGGGLYALGLIHANHGAAVTEYLLNQLKEASTEMVRHGGCLGLGLAAMGSARQDVYDQLQDKLFQDDAVTGEAAGIAMGLVMLGTKSPEALQHMLTYAQDTQHEKILRGLALGIALVMFGRREEAEPLIDQLCRDKDPILRWSGMYTLAMAYCGSAHNSAVRRLLHVAVSDTSDDVRRAAVISLGFLLFRTPEQMPSVVSLLAESYNPHVRYGAAMALGIACAGTGLKEAISLLETMTNDPVNYVRQGALIASAFVLIQQNEITCPKIAQFRTQYAKIIADKHDDVMAKFGAILAQGIIDAGGRNVTISLQSRTGHVNMQAAVGLLVFQNFWYWFPLSHFLSLAFVPTCVVGLNKHLKMPKIEFRSGAKPSTFAYPPPLEEKKDKQKEKVETAVLSTTAKQKKKEEKKKADKMEVEEGDAERKPADKEEKMEVAAAKEPSTSKEAEEKPEIEEKKKPELHFEMLKNPARAMRAQLRVLTLPDTCRYRPLKPVSHGGVLMLSDSQPEQDEELIEDVAAGGPKVESDGEEPSAPEPFEWTED